MEIKLSELKSGKVLYTTIYANNFETQSDIDEVERVFSGDFYQVKIREAWFDGIHLNLTEIETVGNIDFLYDTTARNIGFFYCLEGNANCYCKNGVNNIRSIAEKQQHISDDELNNVVLSVSEKVRYVYIQLTKSYFGKIPDAEFNPENLSLKKNTPAEIEFLLQAITNSPHTGRVKRIFIESKILELIIFYINQKTKKGTFSLKKVDIDKILLAKRIVEDNLQNPNSLMELSRMTGINDFKLKKGFKEVTGYTVFGYLYKIRMEKAYHYLAVDKKPVNEVSFLVGYKNPQHFISAFKKLYHILPGSLNRN